MSKHPLNKASVLVISMGYPPDLGGVQTYAQEIAHAYARKVAQCYVITAHSGTLGVRKEGPVCVLNVGTAAQPVIAARMVLALWRLRRSPRTTHRIVHATTWRVALAAIAAGMSQSLLLTVHGREVLATHHPLLKWLMYRALAGACSIVAISRFSLERCVPKRFVHKAAAHWNGVSDWAVALGRERARREDPTADRKPINVLFAARLVQRKNLTGALQAFATFLASGSRGQLVVAGDGPDRRRCEVMAKELGVEANVRFVGHVRDHDLIKLYSLADVFLHPHTHAHDPTDVETFCLSVADAMAAGLAVISGRDGAPAEYLQKDRGLLVDGSDNQAILYALHQLHDAPVMRRNMGKRAALFAAEHFSWDAHVAPFVELLSRSHLNCPERP